jgi:hypothetical protein
VWNGQWSGHVRLLFGPPGACLGLWAGVLSAAVGFAIATPGWGRPACGAPRISSSRLMPYARLLHKTGEKERRWQSPHRLVTITSVPAALTGRSQAVHRPFGRCNGGEPGTSRCAAEDANACACALLLRGGGTTRYRASHRQFTGLPLATLTSARFL